MIKPSLKKMVETVVDPGRHLSLETGDAIALFVLGILAGIIGSAVMNSPMYCWGFA